MILFYFLCAWPREPSSIDERDDASKHMSYFQDPKKKKEDDQFHGSHNNLIAGPIQRMFCLLLYLCVWVRINHAPPRCHWIYALFWMPYNSFFRNRENDLFLVLLTPTSSLVGRMMMRSWRSWSFPRARLFLEIVTRSFECMNALIPAGARVFICTVWLIREWFSHDHDLPVPVSRGSL